jgi:hypothetical protein
MWTKKELINYLRDVGWLDPDPTCSVPKAVLDALPGILEKLNQKNMTQSRLTSQIISIAKEFGLIYPWHEPPFKIIRTYAGYWQRSSGAWLWWLSDNQGREVVGSCDRASEIPGAHKEHRLSVYYEYGSPVFIIESRKVPKKI